MKILVIARIRLPGGKTEDVQGILTNDAPHGKEDPVLIVDDAIWRTAYDVLRVL